MLTRYSNNPGPLPADLIRAQRHLSTKTNKYKGKKEEKNQAKPGNKTKNKPHEQK
jgi:hypothetical protein